MKLKLNFDSKIATAVLAIAFCLLSHSNVKAMTSKAKFFSTQPQAALESAIREDDVHAIREALYRGASVNAKGRFNVTPLMVAVDAQCPKAVEALLDAGALPNAVALDGNGAVSLAVKSYLEKPYGREIMLTLFKRGGDLDTRQPDGDPVLMRFVYDRDVADIALMKRLGANLNSRDRGGDPLVTKLAMSQDWDIVWAFIELGAEVDYENGKSRQPLSLALKGSYPAPDSPLHAYKVKVWTFLHDKGLALPPLQ